MMWYDRVAPLLFRRRKVQTGLESRCKVPTIKWIAFIPGGGTIYEQRQRKARGGLLYLGHVNMSALLLHVLKRIVNGKKKGKKFMPHS